MAFTEEMIQKVWEKGNEVNNNDPERFRKDDFGAWIDRLEYGNRKSDDGWEIDHINPEKGDDIKNLRPLQWKNNLAKSDGKGKCAVTANGTKNVELK